MGKATDVRTEVNGDAIIEVEMAEEGGGEGEKERVYDCYVEDEWQQSEEAENLPFVWLEERLVDELLEGGEEEEETSDENAEDRPWHDYPEDDVEENKVSSQLSSSSLADEWTLPPEPDASSDSS